MTNANVHSKIMLLVTFQMATVLFTKNVLREVCSTLFFKQSSKVCL